MRKCNMVWNEQYMAAIVSYLSYDEYASILEFVVIWKILDFRCWIYFNLSIAAFILLI